MEKQRDIKRILILGHSGFIGNHLMDFSVNNYPGIELIGKSIPEIDLTNLEDTEQISAFLDMNTAVIMCAVIKRQFGDNLDSFNNNLRMVMNLCRLIERNPVKRVVFFSSAAVYGEDIHNTNITEDTFICPTSYYGIAKYTSEVLLKKTFDKLKDSSLFILRPPLIYGPNDLGATYGPAGFIKAALNREKITLWGDGTELREFIFIEDIVKIVANLVFSSFEGVVNISSGKSSSFRDILDIVSDLSGIEPEIFSRPRTKDKVDNQFCNNKFVDLFGAFEFTALKEGIKKTIDFEKEKCSAEIIER